MPKSQTQSLIDESIAAAVLYLTKKQTGNKTKAKKPSKPSKEVKSVILAAAQSMDKPAQPDPVKRKKKPRCKHCKVPMKNHKCPLKEIDLTKDAEGSVSKPSAAQKTSVSTKK